jgi:hypothetical protein
MNERLVQKQAAILARIARLAPVSLGVCSWRGGLCGGSDACCRGLGCYRTMSPIGVCRPKPTVI